MKPKSKLWPYKEAYALIKSRKHLDRPFHLQTGFGASGLPHIGTFGEAAKTYYIILALEDLGYEAKMFTYSDDMDGMRKLPETFPPEWKKYLGKPVCDIPDPFGEFPSMSQQVNSQAKALIEQMGIPFTFLSSAEEYRKGTLNEQIKLALENYEQILDIILPTIGLDESKESNVREVWFPFLPICKNCGKINTSRVLEVDREKYHIHYVCDQIHKGIEGCGYEGDMSALNGNGKFPWKVDWAARWAALDIDYELYGKDLVESAKLSKKIVSKVFHKRPPDGLFYELFLDNVGRKISKSLGNGLTLEEWFRYGSMESLLYLMLRKPTQAKKLHTGTIFQYESELNRRIDDFYDSNQPSENERKGNRSEYEFITFFSPPKEKPLTVDMETFVAFIGAMGTDDENLIFEYASKCNVVPESTSLEEFRPFLIRGKRYFEIEVKPYQKPPPPLDNTQQKMVKDLFDFLVEPRENVEIHNQLYEIARTHETEPPALFSLLYRILLHQERGPRLANFINLIGKDKVREELAKYFS